MGRGGKRPYPLRNLGINAVPLRFLNFVISDAFKVKIENFYIKIPHPINFSLHKLIISGRRQKEEKALKDSRMGISILKALIKNGEIVAIQKVFRSIPGKWQTRIEGSLRLADETELLDTLKISQ